MTIQQLSTTSVEVITRVEMAADASEGEFRERGRGEVWGERAEGWSRQPVNENVTTSGSSTRAGS